MWTMIQSLDCIVDDLEGAFTAPSFATGCELFLGWIMCLGRRTLFRVAENTNPQKIPDHSQRHDFDVYYNFFARSAWNPTALAHRVGVLILTRLRFTGCITLLVDDTLTHKTGKSVWGLGWFRDAVASTRKRMATASGHNWVVVAIAFCDPLTKTPILALPLLARLHQPGKGQPSCPALARHMLLQVLEWFPTYRFTLVGDGAYATKVLLADLSERVHFVGRMRGDAAVYNPQVPKAKKPKRGPKSKKGPRLPSPREAARKADRKRTTWGEWLWQTVSVCVYGKDRELQTVSYEAVWPHVLGLRPVKIVVVRDPSGGMDDIYLFTTDLEASVSWVITQFAWRWSIEVLFRASKQVMDIEAPQHWCKESVEKVAPWVWSMQSVILVWYLTAGRDSAEAAERRTRMGEWDSEFSLRHMLLVLRQATLNATIDHNSHDPAQLRDMLQTVENWALMAA